MKSFAASSLALLVCLATAVAQQPNTPTASLVFAGQDGPAYPTTVNWQGTQIGMAIGGTVGQPYLIYGAGQNLAGGLSAGLLTVPGLGIVDINIAIGFTPVMDGFRPVSLFDLLARVDPTGVSEWTFPIATTGRLGAFQGAVADPTSATGATLTAASEVFVTVGQNLLLATAAGGGGDDVAAVVNLAFGTVQFYGTTYTQTFVSSNGNVTFGGADADFLPDVPKFDAGRPRMAPLWSDFLPGATVGGVPLIGTFVEDATGWTFSWLLMGNYAGPNATTFGTGTSSFSLTYAYTATNTRNPTGSADAIIFDYSTPNTQFAAPIPGNISCDWGVIGIGPGGTAPAAPANPATSTPLDPGPFLTFDPATQPTSTGGGGLLPNVANSSYRRAYAPGTFPRTLFSGTGRVIAWFPLGPVGTFYQLF